MPRLVPPAFPFELNFEICNYCENMSNFHDVDTYKELVIMLVLLCMKNYRIDKILLLHV